MFMRYRGGGVGHTYMRAIEQWLWETGWGWKTPDVVEEDSEESSPQQEGSILAEDNSDSESDPNNLSQSGEGESEEEVPESEDEIFEDEETLEGEFGYSTF